MLRPCTGTLVWALSASALILPPGIAPANNDDHSSIPSIVNPKNQLIQIPCPACAFSPKGQSIGEKADLDDLYRIQGGANDVLFNFSISDDGLALEFNGKSIYAPLSPSNALFEGEIIHILQVPAAWPEDEYGYDEARKVPLEVTSLTMKEESARVSSQGDVIVQLRLYITELEGVLMQLDGVRIHLLRTSAGEILILRLDLVPDGSLSPLPGLAGSLPSDMPDPKKCAGLSTAFCKFRDMVEAKIEDMRHSPSSHVQHPPDLDGPPPPPSNPHNLDFDAPPPPHRGRPHHVRPHGEHHHRHGPPGFHSFTRNVISILIPVMAGITVGLLVSLLGLLVGRMVGFLWLRVYPSKRRTCHCRSRNDSRAEEGKIRLSSDSMEPLPPYESAPAYEEVETRPS